MLFTEFWNARIQAADPPIRPAQTRIPEVPDQTEFLQSWYDYHRGYRIEKRGDGTEERVEVRGEPLRDVAPGHLPRSPSDIRANAVRIAQLGAHDPVVVGSQRTRDGALPTRNTHVDVSEPASNNQAPRQNILEATRLDTLATNLVRGHNDLRVLNEVSGTRENRQNRAIQAEYQARRIGALRRELQRMRNGIERVMAGLNELGEYMPESQDAIRRSTNLDQRLETIQDRLDGTSDNGVPVGLQQATNRAPSAARSLEMTAAHRLATDNSQYNTSIPPPGETLLATLNRQLDLASASLMEARRTRDESSRIRQVRESEVQLAAARVRQLEREKQILEQNTRIFGSREEVERLGSDYESPIANMFNRAYVWRARVQEEERRRQEPAMAIAEAAMHGPETTIDVEDITAVQRASAYSNIAHNAGSAANPRPGEAEPAGLDGLISMQSRLYRALGEPGVHNEQQAEQVREIHNTTGARYHPLVTYTPSGPIRYNPWQLGAPSDASERNRREFSLGHTVEVVPAVENGENHGESEPEERSKGLDDDDGRPAPKSDDEMTLKLECKVCYSQVADVAFIPCGHLVMCEVSYASWWCKVTY